MKMKNKIEVRSNLSSISHINQMKCQASNPNILGIDIKMQASNVAWYFLWWTLPVNLVELVKNMLIFKQFPLHLIFSEMKKSRTKFILIYMNNNNNDNEVDGANKTMSQINCECRMTDGVFGVRERVYVSKFFSMFIDSWRMLTFVCKYAFPKKLNEEKNIKRKVILRLPFFVRLVGF